jgi:hypothetical protein
MYLFCPEEESLCGDYLVEPGEDCDGGLEGMFGLEKCCDSNCKLRAPAMCRYFRTCTSTCHTGVI